MTSAGGNTLAPVIGPGVEPRSPWIDEAMYPRTPVEDGVGDACRGGSVELAVPLVRRTFESSRSGSAKAGTLSVDDVVERAVELVGCMISVGKCLVRYTNNKEERDRVNVEYKRT